MPLFRSKFQPKKSPARRAASVSNLQRGLDVSQVENEFAIQFDTIELQLDDHVKFEFNDKGKWIQVGSKPKSSPAGQKLQTENDLLHIQVELLLNMVLCTQISRNKFCIFTLQIDSDAQITNLLFIRTVNRNNFGSSYERPQEIRRFTSIEKVFLKKFSTKKHTMKRYNLSQNKTRNILQESTKKVQYCPCCRRHLSMGLNEKVKIKLL